MHRSYEELGRALNKAAEVVEVGGVYAHYKDSASRYRVLGFTILEASDEVAVRYMSVDHEEVEFIRPLARWLDVVDGEPRYALRDDQTD